MYPESSNIVKVVVLFLSIIQMRLTLHYDSAAMTAAMILALMILFTKLDISVNVLKPTTK